MNEKIAILHINDLHSHFEAAISLKNMVFQRRQQLQQDGYEVIVVDDGDFLDRYHPLTEATLGQVNVEFLNYLGVQYFTIGNNEGLGLQKKQLMHLYDHAQGTCVLGNLYDGKQLAPFAKRYAIHQTKNGQKIAFIGLTAPYPESYGPLGWEITDPLAELQDIYTECQHIADKFVLLSHLGYHPDVEIAKKCPWLSAIIGGHTHHLLERGEIINGVILVAAKKHGMYLGELDLTNKKACVHTLTKNDDLNDELMKQGNAILEQTKYGYLDYNMSAFDFTAAVLRQLRLKYQCDLGILNSGLCVKDICQGLVTKATLHTLFPHPMHILIVKMKGFEIRRLLFEMEKNQPFLRKFALTGFGFRGKLFGDLIFDSSKIFSLEQIQDDEIYRVLTVDHYSFIPFFPTISYAGSNKIEMDYFLREQIAMILPQMSQIKERE